MKNPGAAKMPRGFYFLNNLTFPGRPREDKKAYSSGIFTYYED
jgi:hypothetical protein